MRVREWRSKRKLGKVATVPCTRFYQAGFGRSVGGMRRRFLGRERPLQNDADGGGDVSDEPF